MNIKVSQGRDFIILILEKEEFDEKLDELLDLGYRYEVISDEEERDLMGNSPKDYNDEVLDEITDKVLRILKIRG